MKFNKYARHYTLDDLHVLFNMLNDVVIIVDDDVFETIEPMLKTPLKIKEVHPDLFAALVDKEFIVEASADEAAALVETWRLQDTDPEEIKLTVNPTLQCNLRCWYCYEDHTGLSKVSAETLSAIKNLIDNILSRPTMKKLILDFFGGEPLLYFDSCMKPLVEYAVASAVEKGKQIGVAMTTNGTLLTPKILDTLKQVPGPVSMQITLDGDRDRHNKIRFFESGKGTFDIIVGNIKRALSYGYHVSVRYNYTSQNFGSYRGLLPEFENLNDDMKGRLDFSFHKVWQETQSDDVEQHILETKSNYSASGFGVNLPVTLGAGICYADRTHNLVINHNGLVYRCTARDFTPENAEGELLADGHIAWNDRFFRREQVKFGSETCQTCTIFPMCHNGCSQDKLEQEDSHGNCPRGYSEQLKEELAKTRAAQLVQFKAASNN